MMSSTASYTKSDHFGEPPPSDLITDEENIQLSLAPHIQTYLAQVSQQSGCWGKCLPIPFERAASRSWWDPTFDSEILEEQYKKSANPHNRLKFRYALWYVLLISSLWFAYFLTTGLANDTQHWPLFCIVLAVVILLIVTILKLTFTDFYNVHMLSVSLTVALILCMLSLMLIPMQFEPNSNHSNSYLSPLGQFSICIEILLLIYTAIPLPLFVCLTIGVLYSILFELLIWILHGHDYTIFTITIKLLAHICIHLIGLHILIMSNVRMRNTFMKVGQSLLVGQQLKSEKNLKEQMLHSLMPPKVAAWLLSDDQHFTKNGMESRYSNPETSDIQTLFRPFNMNRMENVSILFADIVGFTKMSSTKNAEELVEILNKLFGKFDDLCKEHNCEKISTLGDCYYCVSGCPEPRSDHAKCCVEMGLSMIEAIKKFDREQNEGVNMRVGVHTGTVLCGIVGTKRFKFDVWSNDVTLANRMEATGKPGMVHISEKTCEFLQDMFLVDEGDPVFGLKTFFILGRKSERPPSYCGSLLDHHQNASLQLIVSPPSMSPQTRPRVLSCDNSANMISRYNPNQLSPDVCKVKANSLPSILDEQEIENEKDSCDGAGNAKTPTSTASSGRYSVKLKNWKIPKFLRKSEPSKNDNELSGDAQNLSNYEESLTSSGYQQVPVIVESHIVQSKANSKIKEKGSFSNISHIEEDKQNCFDLDVKSYISQSRSDIGHYDLSSNEFSNFIRSSSYRSQYGRSPNEFAFLNRSGSNRSRRGKSPNFDVLPAERTRSATVAVGNTERHKKSLEVPVILSAGFVDDRISTAQSINSRKDSGIKSNSRRSSIQQFENQLQQSDILQHRVSGYYTSSQTSVQSPQFFDKFGSCIQNLRKQSDRQLIICVQRNSRSEHSYFIKPPLSKFSLFFEDKKMEQEYRANVHSILEQPDITTLATSRFNTYFDVAVSAAVFSNVSLCLFLLNFPTTLWLIIFAVSIFTQICAILLCFDRIVQTSENIFNFCSSWYRWNCFGGTLVSLPIIAVLCNFTCLIVSISDYMHSYLLFVGIVHFCNFTQLNCWMKNILATCFGTVFVCLILTGHCPCSNTILENRTLMVENLTVNISGDFEIHYHNINLLENKNNLYDSEIAVDIALLLVLVWFLNREFEIGYRLSFHANFVANRDKMNVQTLKNQADWLIYNIVPEHVAEQLKKKAKYSENFENVAIIFASIVNFNEMYDESYLGGKEFLRVLNELIGDFDELLTLPEFRSVEKIKTIGSTFMAGSGLNSTVRLAQEDAHEHLYALMDFAMAMQQVVDNFNCDLLEFNLILRIGYNFGDVTAAVIGNTKLYYDIWGDAVNIASRMDSTGVNGEIQVGEHCLNVLEKRYIFEPRGSVYVKGKDNMNVYLLQGKRDGKY